MSILIKSTKIAALAILIHWGFVTERSYSKSDEPTRYEFKQIKKGSFYDQLGLKNGDILLTVNEQKPKSLHDIDVFFRKLSTPGSTLKIRIQRNHKEETFYYRTK